MPFYRACPYSRRFIHTCRCVSLSCRYSSETPGRVSSLPKRLWHRLAQQAALFRAISLKEPATGDEAKAARTDKASKALEGISQSALALTAVFSSSLFIMSGSVALHTGTSFLRKSRTLGVDATGLYMMRLYIMWQHNLYIHLLICHYPLRFNLSLHKYLEPFAAATPTSDEQVFLIIQSKAWRYQFNSG